MVLEGMIEPTPANSELVDPVSGIGGEPSPTHRTAGCRTVAPDGDASSVVTRRGRESGRHQTRRTEDDARRFCGRPSVPRDGTYHSSKDEETLQ